MKKVFIVSCIVLLLSASMVFAQNERSGVIIGTFGLGGGFTRTVETTGMFSFAFDLNLISKAGFTLSFTDVVGISSSLGWLSQNIMFGGGYHYMKNKWNIGLSILLCPTGMDMLLGGKIDGGYYFTDNLGLTGVLVYSQTLTNAHYEMSMFNAFMGVSVRLF
jgi:hypothetical protein